MKGWKINVAPYETETPVVDVTGAPVMRDGKPIKKKENVDVKDNLADMLFNPQLKLRPEELFEAKDLADKIRASEDTLILDTKEMDAVKRAYNALRGLPEQLIEFLRRIKDAEEIELTVKES